MRSVSDCTDRQQGDSRRDGVRIVLVENEGLIALDLSARLRGMGYEVVGTAPTAAEAILLARESRPDLILMDIVLEGEMDGIEAAALIRSSLHLPVVFLTSHTDERTLQRAKATDGYGYVSKPFADRELHATIQFAVHRAALEQEIEQQRNWLHGVLHSVSEAIVATDAAGNINLMNPAARCLTGLDDRALGRPVSEQVALLSAGKQLDGAEHPVNVVLSRRMPALTDRDLACVSRTGVTTDVDIEVALIGNSRGDVEGAVLAMRDVSGERRARLEITRANRALRELSAELMRSQDNERRRIARDLHDSTGQALAGVCMLLAQIGRPELPEPRRAELMRQTERLANQCSKEIRSLSYLLHPPLLDELGLATALRNFVRGYSERSGIEVAVSVNPDFGRLATEIETTLFRIVQEALTNVQRHSGTRQAEITLVRGAASVQLEVTDHGRGLDESGSEGVGMIGMRERARALGGDLVFVQQKPGLTIRATLPCPTTGGSSGHEVVLDGEPDQLRG